MDKVDTNATSDNENNVDDGLKEQNTSDKDTEQCASDVNTLVTPDPVLEVQLSVSGSSSPSSARVTQGACVTSDNESDSCTDSDALMTGGRNTDDTGSTSESEDTQM